MSIHIENKTLRSLITTRCVSCRVSTNRFLVLSLLAAIALCTGSTQAANGTWLNTGASSANWTTANNWASGTVAGGAGVPGGSANTYRDTATFNTVVGTYGTSGTPILIDSSTGWQILTITFDTNAGNYNIGTIGGNPLQLCTDGTIQVLNSLTAANIIETINAPLVLQWPNQTYNFVNNGTQSSTTLKINGQVSMGATGTKTLYLSGSNTGSNTVSGAIVNGTGAIALAKNGTGTWILSGANTYSGATTVSAGLLTIDAGAGGALLNTGAYSALAMGGGTFNYDNTTAAGVKSQNMGALTFTAGDNMVIATRTAAQTVALTFSSLGTRTAGAIANFVYGGTPGTIGTDTAINLTGKAAGFIDQGTFYNGGTSTADFAWMNGAGTYIRGINYGTDANSESITASTAAFTGGKLYAWINGSGAITGQTTASITSMNIANANNVTLAGGATLTINGILKSGNAAGGSITGGTGIQAGSGAELVVRTDQSSDTLTLSTPILANGTNALTKSGTGTLTLTSTNTYAGATYLNAGTLKLANQFAATNSTVTMAGGTLVFDSVAGTNFTFGGLAAASAGTSFGFGLTNSAGNAIALTIGGNNAATTYAGVLSGAGSLTKAGTNTLTLSGGSSTFTGDVNINTGTVILASAYNGANNRTATALGNTMVARNINVNSGATLKFGNASCQLGEVTSTITAVLNINGGTFDNGGQYAVFNNVNLNGGTMTASGSNLRINGNVTVGGSVASLINGTGTANVAANFNVADVTASPDPDLTISAVIANATGSSLTKSGIGTLRLSGANTYTGTTTVSNGTLQVDGSLAAASTVTVVAGGTLRGTGTINGIVTNRVGGTLAPGGASIGTLTNKSMLTLLSGSTNVFRINKTGAVLASDRVTGMTGVIYGGTLSVTATGDALAIGDTFTLFTKASGSYSGSFSTTNLPALPGDREWNTATLISDGTISVMVKGGQVPVLTPTFNPDSGGYFGAQTITISCGDAGSTVFYTLDGSTPTNTSPSGVAGSASAIVIVPSPTNITIKAYATNSGMLDSAVSSATYTTVAGSTATWTNLVSGSWTVAGNWLNKVVGQGIGITADFSTLTLAGNTSVSLGSALTIGNLVFGDMGNVRTWTVNADLPAYTLTLAGTNTPVIMVNNQSAAITAVLVGTNGMSKTGAGTLTLSGANTFTGDVNIDAGTVTITGGTGPLGSTTAIRNINVNNGGTLLLSGVVVLGEVATQPMPVLVVNAGGMVIDSGNINVFNNVTLNGGTIKADNSVGNVNGCFQVNGKVTVAGSVASSIIGSTDPTSQFNLSNTDANLRTTVFNVADATVSAEADLIIAASVRNGFSLAASHLIKTGTGTMVLTTNNTYTGTTTVSNGTLQVNGAIASSSATVITNAVLCGTGTLGNNVTINAGGILAAGTTNTVGGAAIAGALTLQDNSRLLVDVLSLSQNDLITVAGNVSLTPTLKVEVSGGVTRSGTWTILQSTGGTISGTLPATVIGGTKGATLSKSGDSKQLLLTFLPQGTLIRIF